MRSFAFGRNWQEFIRRFLDQGRIEEAVKSLSAFCRGYDFKGKTFLDAGCGSGLFSLAACRLGASRVVSFDVDSDSVHCCRYLHDREGKPAHWQVMQGSILDEHFMAGLGRFDCVYSWGVLHHTGNLWKAVENASRLVAKGGVMYLAIYNRADGICLYPDGRFGPSTFWVKVKRAYSRSPLALQKLIDASVMSFLVLAYCLTLRNPVEKIRRHRELRGMSWRIDIRDWLGGYPYEYASVAEVFAFVRKLGFSLENLKCTNGLGNNEYLFKKC
ncbi:MAG: class I SAM-dependent methyltransferase [bacterium]|nr:class I SAM-dependent methyltransferase [bacterium]